MKTTFSNKELAHIWAQQKQDSGKGSHMFFEGKKIYSYGHHFCIANFIKPEVVLFTSSGYSVTTSKHKSYVSRAIHSVKVFVVPSIDFDLNYKNTANEQHAKNLLYYKGLIESEMAQAEKSTKFSADSLAKAKMIQSKASEYCKEFALPKKMIAPWIIKPIQVSKALQTKIDNQQEKAIQLAEKKEREEKERNRLIIEFALPAWLNNQESFEYGNGSHNTETAISKLSESYLRLREDKIYTSHGASVSVKAAKILFERIKSGKDIRGFEIDGYTVIGINGVLTIGCHKIERSEINRFAASMNWGQIDMH